jgi:hypothetical protein
MMAAGAGAAVGCPGMARRDMHVASDSVMRRGVMAAMGRRRMMLDKVVRTPPRRRGGMPAARGVTMRALTVRRVMTLDAPGLGPPMLNPPALEAAMLDGAIRLGRGRRLGGRRRGVRHAAILAGVFAGPVFRRRGTDLGGGRSGDCADGAGDEQQTEQATPSFASRRRIGGPPLVQLQHGRRPRAAYSRK